MYPPKYMIIDTEGTFLKKMTPQYKVNSKTIQLFKTHLGNYTVPKIKHDTKTMIITEVSYIIIENAQIKEACYMRLNYDLRNIFDDNIKTLKYIKKFYPNTFRNLKYDYKHMPAFEMRNKILQCIIDNDNLPVYAKGATTENIWLYHPECCDGNTVKLDKSNDNKTNNKINEIYGVPRYDNIIDKNEIISRYLLNLKLEKNDELDKDINKHISLYECIVFFSIIRNRLFDYQSKDIKSKIIINKS